MTLMRFDPFRELDRFGEQVMSGGRVWRSMPMEAFRRGDDFVVAIDVPGTAPEDVEVTVEGNVVNIRARRGPLHKDGDEVLVDERPRGEFTRQLVLGDNLDPGKLSADVSSGVLTLTIPVAEESKPRRIEIPAHSSS
jgi:HSP20 family protein